MQFNPVSVLAAPSAPAATPAARAVSGSGLGALASGMGRRSEDSQPEAGAVGVILGPAPASTPPSAPPPPAYTRGALVEASQNLLKHIPGEASGFYLLAVDSIKEPSLGNLGLIFTLAFILLVVVRWLAKASWGITITTIVAFAIWMLIFDKGFLHVLFPNLLPAPMGLIVAVFYSMLITLLASAGKIR